MTRALRALFLLSVAAPVAFAIEAAPTIPRPHGWVGTADEWTRALGIGFALLDLLLLALAWRTLRRTGESPLSKELLFGAIAVLPLAVVFFGYSYGLEASKKVEACGSCHVMTPWVKDLRDPKSETLAAVHFKNRYIQENHCFTCHSDYGLGGTIAAKAAGLGHVWRYTTGAYSVPIKIAQPYSNLRCLQCHGSAQKFLASEGHPKEVIPDLVAGKVSCLDCHGPAHPDQKQAARP